MINYKKHNTQRSSGYGNICVNEQRQAGGTLIGLIIGLIIGLGIALGVALVISKTPVPFLNRLAKEKPAELTPSQAADPNKPMYGNKEPAKEAAKDFAAKEPEPVAGAGEPGADASKQPGIAGADKTKAADKLDGKPADGKAADGKTIGVKSADGKTADGKPADGKPADSKTADSKTADSKDAKTLPPKADNTEEKWVYYLQAGAFREQTDADSAKAKLALTGFEASISERSAESGLLYRVRIGPFNQLEAMNRARVKLSDNGMDVAVIKIAK